MAAIRQTEPAHSLLYAPGSLVQNARSGIDDAFKKVNEILPKPYNDGQAQVFQDSFRDRVLLLWGPPGTGKTTVLAGIILGWIEHAEETNKPVSVCVGSSNWTAINNLLFAVADLIARRKELKGDFRLGASVSRLISGLGKSVEYFGVEDIKREDAGELIDEMNAPTRCLVVGTTWKQLYNLSMGTDFKNAEDASPQRWFDLLLIDEASQVKVSHAAAYFLMLKEQANVVLAGDDKQLGPVFGFQVQDHSQGLFDCIYTYMKETHGITPKQIIHNYRSNDQITSWPNQRFYEKKLISFFANKRLPLNLPAKKPDTWSANLLWSDFYLDLLSPDHPITVVTYPAQTFTVFNPFEAQVTAALSHLFRLSLGAETDDMDFCMERLGIVTPHRAQRSNIQNIIAKQLGLQIDPSTVVDTVDRFQGQERDLIIASYTVADKDFVMAEEEFILDPRRFNVSLTRARSKFIMLVSESILEHLPSDKLVATNASHIQLFSEKHCKIHKKVSLPYVTIDGEERSIACQIRYGVQ